MSTIVIPKISNKQEESQISYSMPVINPVYQTIPIDEYDEGYKKMWAKIFISKLNDISQKKIHYEEDDDFKWFTSGQVETDRFKGKHIAIWRKQIVGNGETPLEAERNAKKRYGNNCKPAIVYIPKDEEVDTIF